MNQSQSNHGDEPRISAPGVLFGVATELRSLAYLFETQGTKATQIAESDMDEISHGMGRILKRLARKVRRVSRRLDEENRRPKGASA